MVCVQTCVCVCVAGGQEPTPRGEIPMLAKRGSVRAASRVSRLLRACRQKRLAGNEVYILCRILSTQLILQLKHSSYF